MRLNKFLAENLGVSRRAADNLIAAGRVRVAGKVATLGVPVADEIVEVDGKKVAKIAAKTYLVLNKPVGYTSSRRAQHGKTLYELLPEKYRTLKTVGRLDKESSGLIILTDDGDFNFKMTHPSFKKTKVYEVELDRALEPLHQQMIADFGVELLDGASKLALMRLDEKRKKWRIEMSEGRNRQIRRTFGALGYTVVKLHRTQFGKYGLGVLKSGEYDIIEL
ncbi:MAG: pseudouridine synthase [Candidatus Nomurabacteria bacterium]|jgi:23S rRNA pseudouridine2605 synthase|nr:pseudouridine synthase [Candidatus Nomurabacteria bacterium]